MTTKKSNFVGVLVVLLLGLPWLLSAQGRPKPGEPFAVINGTVFQPSGFSFPGVAVVLSLKEQPTKKLQEMTTTARGEFSFRVPDGERIWLLTASRKGFVTVVKEVEIVGQEQIHATLTLEPESKK
jgi:hypothetical protein